MSQRTLDLLDLVDLRVSADTETPIQRPTRRSECDPSGCGPWVQRPCVFVSCRHHLLSHLDADGMEAGMNKLVRSAEADRILPSCSLDLVDQLGEMSTDEIARVMSEDEFAIMDALDEVISDEGIREVFAEHYESNGLDQDQIELLVANAERYGVEETAVRMSLSVRVVRSHHERYLTRMRIKEGQEPDDYMPTLEEAGLEDLIFEDAEEEEESAC